MSDIREFVLQDRVSQNVNVYVTDPKTWASEDISYFVLPDKCCNRKFRQTTAVSSLMSPIYHIQDRYFIWQLWFVTSRRYLAVSMGGRVSWPTRSGNEELPDKIKAAYLTICHFVRSQTIPTIMTSLLPLLFFTTPTLESSVRIPLRGWLSAYFSCSVCVVLC